MGVDDKCSETVCFVQPGFSSHSNYCAANAAVDAVAEEAACQGVPFVSVQWGAWSAVGEQLSKARSSIHATTALEHLQPNHCAKPENWEGDGFNPHQE